MNSLQALNLAAPMADTYNRLEEMLLCHIAEQLAANPDTLINATSQWRIKMLAQMGRLTADTAKIIAQMTSKAPEMVKQVVSAAVDEVLDEYGLELTEKLSDNISQSLKNYDKQAVKSKYNQVNTVMQYKAKQLYTKSVNGVADRFERIKQKSLDNAQEYLDVLNKNAMAVTLGEKSRTEALRETIAEMNSKGIPAFVDASGREWTPEAYINMDIRNTAKNSALAAEFASFDELGQDVILVSSHSGARPKCFPYQGKFYSISGRSGTITDAKGKTYSYSPLSVTSFGEPDGLFGINCGHRMRSVSDGTFINREEEYDKGENDEEYRQVQRQRQKERQIRKEKTQAKMLEAAGDKEGAKKYRKKASEHNKKLRAYCEENGLSYREDRTKVYGYKKAEKTVDNGAKSGIIKLNQLSKSAKIPDDCTHLLNVDTNFEGKDISADVLKAIDTAIDKRLQVQADFNFDEIKIAAFPSNDKSVLLTNLEVFGGNRKNQLYLNKEYFYGKSIEEIDKLCKRYHDSGWWKSENLEDLVNHEIMHARINNCNSIKKVERLYETLKDDGRTKGFCRFVDEYPDEFLNEMYVAIINGEDIPEKYMNVYSEYIKEFLGG